MTGGDTMIRVGEGEPRRWSEPVRIGEILADLLAAIEASGARAVRQDRIPVSLRGLLRKAG